MRGRRSWLVLALPGALALAGCGGLAFRVVRRDPPSIALVETPREIWLATDVTDPIAARLAERLSLSLLDLAPTRVVPVGAPPEAGVLVVALAVRRSFDHRPEIVQQPVWTCDPTGLCYSRQVPRVVDVPVVRLLVRLSVHDARGRVLTAPRILDVLETGNDEMTAETHLIGRVARDIDAAFRPTQEELSLPVEDPGDDSMASAPIRAAVAAPSTARCLAIGELAERERERVRRGRVLFAAGQCERALAIARSTEAAVDRDGLLRAEALLLGAIRAEPRELYARALSDTRALLRSLDDRASRASEEAAPGIPEPPPAYR